MRVHSYAFLMFLATGGAGAVAACSGDVATTTNATGTTTTTNATGTTTTGVGGAGGSMVTTSTATTTSTTSGTTTASTTGAGGAPGDPKCLETCAKGDMCGFGLCDQFGVDCTNPPAQLTPCIQDCIIAASCEDLAKAANQDFNTPFGACFGACQNGSSSSTGTGGAGGGSGAGGAPPQSCQNCAQQNCGAEVQSCFGDFGSGCPQWLQCLQGCNNNPTPQCAFDCDAAHMNAKAKYEAIYACTCSKCTDSCAALKPCDHLPDGG